MRNTSTQTEFATTISKQELFKLLLETPVLDRRSALEPEDEPMTASERFTWLTQGIEDDTPRFDSPEDLLTILAECENPQVQLECWIEALAAWKFAFEYLNGRCSAVEDVHEVRIVRHDFIEALEKSNDQIGHQLSAINHTARVLVERTEDTPETDRMIENPVQQATLQKFLGEPHRVLDRTYGQAAALVLNKLEPKAA